MMYPTFNSPGVGQRGSRGATSTLRRRRLTEANALFPDGISQVPLTQEELLAIEQRQAGDIPSNIGPVVGAVLTLAAVVFIVGLLPSRR